jgi:uncharacterized protein YraI
MRPRLSTVLAVAALAWPALALGETATITAAVTVRAAPDRHFPSVTWLLGGTSVTVVGCVENWRWCDVVAGRDRGWVYSRYLAYAKDGGKVTILAGGPNLGLPNAEFSLGAYWREHYQGRPWFANQPYWNTRWERRPAPPAWRPPRGTP